jgi:hypothetical protein
MKDYEKKDLILNLFKNEVIPGRANFINIEPLMEITGFDKYRLDSVLTGMKEDRLIEYDGLNSHNQVTIVIKERLYEFYDLGGYTMKYELFEDKFEKLDLEIKKLENKFGLQELSNISSISSSLISMISTVFGK